MQVDDKGITLHMSSGNFPFKTNQGKRTSYVFMDGDKFPLKPTRGNISFDKLPLRPTRGKNIKVLGKWKDWDRGGFLDVPQVGCVPAPPQALPFGQLGCPQIPREK